VTLVKHGGTVNGHMSEFLIAPTKGFGLNVMTNGARGHELGTVVVKWCLSELLGVERPEPTFLKLSRDEASDYTGRYATTLGEYVVTPENGGALLTVEASKAIVEADPDIAAVLPPPLPLGFVAKDRAVVQGDYIPGSRIEFLRDANGDVEWMRFGGRISKKQPA
jgi:hypothetical protein